MPTHIQPLTLENICIKKASLLVSDICHAVESSYQHVRTVDNIQQDSGLEGAREYLLSIPRLLYDRIFNAVHTKKLTSFGFEVFMSLAVHDRIRSLTFDPTWFNSIPEEAVVRVLEGNMRNLVVLHANEILITDNVLKTICCRESKLEKISLKCDFQSFELPSLHKLTLCKALRYIEIEFLGWEENQPQLYPCITMLLTELPKLERFRQWGLKSMDTLLSSLNSVIYLKELDISWANPFQLSKILVVCPNVSVVNAVMASQAQLQNAPGLLTVLAASSVKIEALNFNMMKFSSEMARLLELHGKHIRKLDLLDIICPVLTLRDIYAIGLHCPLLEKLSIFEDRDITEAPQEARMWTPFPNPTTFFLPPMFRHLTRLELDAKLEWDIRVLLHVLACGPHLEYIRVKNMYTHGHADLLSEMLNVNSLRELETLVLQYDDEQAYPPICRHSIQRLVESCPNLRSVFLSLPLTYEASLYIYQLKVRLRNENFDLKINAFL